MKYNCLNNISAIGMARMTADYTETKDVKEAEVILVRSAKMDEIEVGENLIAVARAGAGVNNIPHAEYAKKGIVVFNTPGANANAVKELVLAMMLMASRDLIGGAKWVRENADDADIGKTAEKAKKAFAGTEITGKTLGVVGLGAIGRLVANAAIGLGMKVVGYDPYLSVNAALALNPEVKVVKDIADVYAEGDFITLHLPAVPATKGMVNAAAFATMKTGAILINCARDAIVNEAELLQALETGKLGKYVTDFATPATAKHAKCIVLPHLGASTEEAEDNCAAMAVDEIRNYAENGNIVNSVNYPAVSLGAVKAGGRIGVCHTAESGAAVQAALGAAGAKVTGVASAVRGEIGYTLMDTEGELTDAMVTAVKATAGVIRARKVK